MSRPELVPWQKDFRTERVFRSSGAQQTDISECAARSTGAGAVMSVSPFAERSSVGHTSIISCTRMGNHYSESSMPARTHSSPRQAHFAPQRDANSPSDCSQHSRPRLLLLGALARISARTIVLTKFLPDLFRNMFGYC
jgi:hypothetical protein